MSKPYLHIGEGCGGVYSFPVSTTATDEGTWSIGTTDCRYCVGIYFPLSNEKCFCAHIYACCDDVDDLSPLDVPLGPWVPFEAEGVALTKKVKELLDGFIDELGISRDQLAFMADRAVVVCPFPTKNVHGQVMPTVGKYIIDALDLAFNTTFTAEKAHGFAVDHSTGEHEIFRFTPKGPSKFKRTVVFHPDSEDQMEPVQDERLGWTIHSRADRRNGAEKSFMLKYKADGWEVDHDDSPDPQAMKD
ncbi:hypothetical protein PRZ48_008353 [Zasmidium cellare]|uniref:Uncharacterized protein n=1 Tax=Zasmidium cellare TaxID=395010 RepID=A0ABR0EFA6_ZASCE|nr:hypothetical protein PRZ48_008353 [Zasmidium cellare]